MDIHPRCLICQINRIVEEIQLATWNKENRMKAVKSMLDFYSNEKLHISAQTGQKAREIVNQITLNSNPYKSMKIRINEYAKEQILEFYFLLDKITDKYHKFRLACLSAVIGNLMEFFMLEHSFREQKLIEYIKSEKMAIDNTLEVFEYLKECKRILYLTDNAGEVVFDAFFISILKELFPQLYVIVAVKSGPIINDATLEDAKAAKLDIIADELITTGQPYIGMDYKKTSLEFKVEWAEADLIIAKGMGHFETFDGNYDIFQCPLFYLFRAKCSTVAEAVNVNRNDNVAKFLLFGF